MFLIVGDFPRPGSASSFVVDISNDEPVVTNEIKNLQHYASLRNAKRKSSPKEKVLFALVYEDLLPKLFVMRISVKLFSLGLVSCFNVKAKPKSNGE